MKKYLGYFFAGAALYFGFAGLGYAETTVSAEVQYIFNILSKLYRKKYDDFIDEVEKKKFGNTSHGEALIKLN